MTFLNPFVLFGLAAASLPVLFHLFAQRRARKIEFSSLRFLKKLEKTSMRAVKLRQWLLLLVRTLLIIALVLAFARPALKGYLGGFFGSTHASTTIAILIDNSASMSRSDDHGELFRQAKDGARAIVDLMHPGDDALLLPLANPEDPASLRHYHSARELREAIEKLTLADRSADIKSALRIANAEFASSGNINKEVILLSDGQARNVTGIATSDSSQRFRADTKIFFRTYGEGDKIRGENLRLDSLMVVTTVFESGRPVEYQAFVRNTGSSAVSDAVVSLFYNDQRVAQRTLGAVEPTATEIVPISGPARGTGVLRIRAQLENDALPFDNVRYATVTLPGTRHIGVYMSQGESRYLQLALEQTIGDAANSAFVIDLRPVEELSNLEANSGKYDAIFVEPAGASERALRALGDYIKTGGAAAIFFQPAIDIAAYNKSAANAGLPQIGGVEQSVGRMFEFGRIAQNNPFFKGLFDQGGVFSAARTIESPKIRAFYRLIDKNVLPLISLTTGAPFLAESRIGRGEMIIFAVPPTLDYSDFARRAAFLPLIRRSAAYLSSWRSRAMELSSEFSAGSTIDVRLPEASGLQPGATIMLKDPRGVTSRLTAVAGVGGAHIKLENAAYAGNYLIYKNSDEEEPIAAFSVNLEKSESDLAVLSDREFKKALGGAVGHDIAIHELPGSSQKFISAITQSRYGVELWQAFLVACMVLAIIEMLLAKAPSRYVKVVT